MTSVWLQEGVLTILFQSEDVLKFACIDFSSQHQKRRKALCIQTDLFLSCPKSKGSCPNTGIVCIQSLVISKNKHQNFSQRLVMCVKTLNEISLILFSGSRECKQDTWCFHPNLPLLLPQLSGCDSRHRGGRMGIDHATASQRRIRINLQCRRTGLNTIGFVFGSFCFLHEMVSFLQRLP